MKKLTTLALAIFVSVASASSTEQLVWDHHIQAWFQRDIPELIEDYTEESVVLVNGEAHRGLEEIEKLFKGFFAAFDQAESNTIERVEITGNVVYITWEATFNGNTNYGTDTFVLRGDRILTQTITDLSTLSKADSE